MIFLALLYATLSLHRIIENLKTDLVATGASVASRRAIDLGMQNCAERKALLRDAGGSVRNNLRDGRLSSTSGQVRTLSEPQVLPL